VRGCSWTAVFDNCQCTYSTSTSLMLARSHLHFRPLEIQKEKLQLPTILCVVKSSLVFFLIYRLLMSPSVCSLILTHNDLLQPPLFPSVYDFGFLLYWLSVMPSMLGLSLLSLFSFESTNMPLTIVAFFYFSIAVLLFFFLKKADQSYVLY